MQKRSAVRPGSRLEICLFGHPRIGAGGKSVPFPTTPRLAAMLAYLIVHAGEWVRREVLGAVVWPDDDAVERRKKLRRYLHRLASDLPLEGRPWFEVSRYQVCWPKRADVRIDLFEEVDLERGEFLEGLYDDWIVAERERHQLVLLDRLYDASERARSDRDFELAIRYAERIRAIDPFREDALRLEMTARYEYGDRTGALAAFERFRAGLRRELNVEPMPETVALRAGILAGAPLAAESRETDDEPRAVASPNATPFVGRAAELAATHAAWRRAARGAGTTLFLSGPAGIGKTRLVDELARSVRAEGGRAQIGTTSNPEAMPFEALVDVLRTNLSSIDDAAAPDRGWLSPLAHLLPELRAGDAVHADLEPADTNAAKALLMSAIANAIVRISRSRPLLVVLEDVHWAGAATLEAIEAIARRIGTQPVFFVANFRTGEANAALEALRERLAGEKRATVLELDALSPEAIGELARALPDAPAELGTATYDVSEGNALFAVHLLHRFAESGELPGVAGRSLSHTILSRIGEFEPSVRTLAESAAAIGRSFDAELATRVLGWREDEVYEALSVLIERGIVREAGGSHARYTFTHALIQAAIYEAIPSDQRAHRHRLTAQILSQTDVVNSDDVASIARHWDLAGSRERAAQWYLRAAQRARQVYAFAEAIAHANAAFDRFDEDAPSFEALEVAASALHHTQNAARLEAALAPLREVSERLGARERFRSWTLHELYARRVADDALRERALTAMLGIAQESGDETMLLDAYLAAGLRYRHLGDQERAEAVLREALERADRANDEPRLMLARERLVEVMIHVGKVEACRQELAAQRETIERRGRTLERRLSLLIPETILFGMLKDGEALDASGRELIELAQQTGNAYFEALGHNAAAHAAFLLRDFTAIRAHYARSLELFEGLGDTRMLFTTYNNLADAEISLGHPARALEYWTLAGPHCDKLHYADAACVREGNMVFALIALGRREEALAYARSACELSAQTPVPLFKDFAANALAVALAANGELDAALARFESARTGRLAAEDWYYASLALCGLLDALVSAGRIDAAGGAARELGELYERHPRNVMQPTRICNSLARYYEATPEPARAGRWTARGLALLHELLPKFGDPDDARAFSAMPFNADLLSRQARARG